MSDWKTRAKQGLSEGLKNGDLERLARELEEKEAAMEKRLSEMKSIKQKAKSNLLQGLRTGDLESLQNQFEESAQKAAEALESQQQSTRDIIAKGKRGICFWFWFWN